MASPACRDPALTAQLENLIAQRTAERFESLQAQITALADRRPVPRGLTLIVFSGDLDKLLAAFMLATGGAAMGLQVSMFFTFWGLTVLKRRRVCKGKGLLARLMTALLPCGPGQLRLSRLNLGGLGRRFFTLAMRRHGLERLPGLIALARESGVRMVVCQTSMTVMGITKDELIQGVEYGGVAACLDAALDAGLVMFI